ncbi:hypothetical protein [Carp edema virus]|nr:hypothetical protein [Carp edema virus]
MNKIDSLRETYKKLKQVYKKDIEDERRFILDQFNNSKIFNFDLTRYKTRLNFLKEENFSKIMGLIYYCTYTNPSENKFNVHYQIPAFYFLNPNYSILEDVRFLGPLTPLQKNYIKKIINNEKMLEFTDSLTEQIIPNKVHRNTEIDTRDVNPGAFEALSKENQFQVEYTIVKDISNRDKLPELDPVYQMQFMENLFEELPWTSLAPKTFETNPMINYSSLAAIDNIIQ